MAGNINASQNINQGAAQGVANEVVEGSLMSAEQTNAEGQAAVQARLAGHAVAAMGKALDALDKALI